MKTTIKNKARALLLLPAWREWSAADEEWVSALAREIGARWGGVVVYDPGFPGDARGGMSFTRRHRRDFEDQCREAIFENPIEIVIAVGEAAKPHNLGPVAGWAPMAPRASIFFSSDAEKMRRFPLKTSVDYSDIVLWRGTSMDGHGSDDAHIINTPAEALDRIESRFALKWIPDAPRAKPLPRVILITDARNGSESIIRAILRPLRSRARAVCVEKLSNEDQGGTRIEDWNSAIRRSESDYLIFLNGPVFLADGALARLLEYFEFGVGLGAVGAVDRRAPKPFETKALADLREIQGGHREHGPFLARHCVIVPRQVFSQVGLFDDRFNSLEFALYDYSFRLRQAGFRLLTATDVPAWHILTDGDFPGADHARARAADRDLLIRKWCGNGIGAILRLVGKITDTPRNMADGAAHGQSDASLEIERTAAAMHMEQAGRIENLRKALEAMHKTVDERGNVMSRDFWKMSGHLEKELGRRLDEIARLKSAVESKFGNVDAVAGFREASTAMHMEQAGRIENLRKALEAMHKTVDGLRQEMRAVLMRQQAALLFRDHGRGSVR
ncbi:MAG: glycosyltransferase family 2 protein [Elusimicrobiota bacterium]